MAREGGYPVGIYSVPGTELGEVHRAGFNLVTGPADRDYLDTARHYGIRVLASPHTSAGTNFNAPAARKAIRAHDRHPALWAWYLIDEPDLNRVSPEDVRRANLFLKREGAGKPTALVLFQGQAALEYGRMSDILMIDRYPIPWLPLANFPQHVQLARFAAGEGKPLMAVIQAFDWSYYPELLPGEKNLRAPTEAEIRCMTYAALAERADGLFYYCYGDSRWKIREHPAVWEALKKVVAEVRAREPLFEAEHIWWPVVHRFGDPKLRFNEALDSSVMTVRLRVKRGNQQVPPGDYILAVNNSAHQQDYRLYLDGRGEKEVSVLGEERNVTVLNGWLHETFEAYGVRVFRL